MKRQIVFGFTCALIVGVVMVMGACNKHSFEDTEFNTGVKTLYQQHGEEGHGDAHDGDKAHDSDKGGHDEKKSGAHDAGHKPKKEHKEASAQPAKTLFPKK